jgi:hypothetical protein
MTRTNCDLFTHKSSRSYLNRLVLYVICVVLLVLTLWDTVKMVPGVKKKHVCTKNKRHM